MELFISTYVNKVDRKGRVSVPATFRSTLANNRQPNLLIAFPSFRLAAVECTGSDRMEEIHERMETLGQFSDEHDNLSQLFADAHQLLIDGDGRVTLPEKLKDYAAIADDVAFVGRGAMFQIWNPARYADYSSAIRERSRAQGAILPPRGGAPRPSA